MKLTDKQNDYRNYSSIALMLYHLQNVKFTESSFRRFGDKNQLTKGLKTLYIDNQKGQSIDKFVKDSLSDDFSNLDEQQKIELTVDTMIKFDNKAEIDRYFKSIQEQKTKAVKKAPIKVNEVKPCLVKASLKHMNRAELREELNSLISSPRAYFGALLEVDECKTDLFTVTEKEQILIAKAMLKQLDDEDESKNKPKYSLGKQKPLALGYGDTLKVQPAYSNLKNKPQPMATKKTATAKKSPAKKTTKAPAKKKTGGQKEAQNYIKRVSAEATKIQKEGGFKFIPAKKVYSVNRADAVKKAAQKIK